MGGHVSFYSFALIEIIHNKNICIQGYVCLINDYVILRHIVRSTLIKSYLKQNMKIYGSI